MASLSMVFDLVGRDQGASKTFKDVGNAAERAGKQGHEAGSRISSGMKLAAGALLGGGLIAGFKGLYDAAAESQRIGRLTTQVIQSTGGAAGVTAKQVSELAEAIARKTGVDDEAIQSGQNLLLTFTNIKNAAGEGNDIFNRATQTITDMSVALGQDMKSSALQLGKALNDPIRGVTALQRVGVSFTESQKDQIRTLVESGRTMEAQKIILQELGKEFGGAAEAAATPMDKLKVTLGNVAEEVGGQLVPVVDRLANFLMDDLLPAAEGIAPAFGTVLDVLGGVAGVAGSVLRFFGDLPGPLQVGAIAFGAWAVAGDKIMGILRPMGGVLSGLRGTWQSFGEALGYARDRGDGLGSVLKSVGQYAGGQTVSAIKGLARAIGPELGIAAAVTGVATLVTGILNLGQASDEAQAAAKGLADSLTLVDKAADRRAVRDALEDIDGLVESLAGAGVASGDAINGLLGQAAAQDRVIDSLNDYYTELLSSKGPQDAQVIAVGNQILAYKELATGYDNAAGSARYFGESSGAAVAGAEATGEAAEGTVEQVDEAAAAIQRWRQQLAGINDSFVEPLSIYQEMLQTAAQATADATESSKDSWKDYVDSTKVSLDDLAQKLQEQISAQENWRTNLVTISQRGGDEVAQILADMGVEGAGYVQQMVDANAEDFARMRDLLIRDAQLGGQGAADALDEAMRVMALIGRDGSVATVQAVARELGIGVGRVREIARQYGVELASGLNPILQGLGKAHIELTTRGYGFNAGGGLAEGGPVPGWSPTDTADNVLIRATAGEFMQPLPAVRKYGIDFMEAVRTGLFPVELTRAYGGAYAGGGFVSTGSVPRPPSTAPARFPISTPADATMQREYDETIGWLKQNLAPPLSPGMGWEAMMRVLRVPFPGLALISGFRPGSITATGNLSYHATGRAVDVPPSWDVFNWIAAHYPNSRELIFSPAGNRQIWNGAPHWYNEPTRGDHWDHVHWAYDKGGLLPPGLTLAYNGTGRPETVRTAEQEAALHRPMELSDRTIDRLAAAMVRGAGAAISQVDRRQRIDWRSS